jgi:alanine racemase
MHLHALLFMVCLFLTTSAQSASVPPPHLQKSAVQFFKKHPVSDTWITVNKKALVHNITRIKKMSSPRKVCAVVKADAYGHGIHLVAPVLAPYADAFCVTDNIEIAHIRALGLKNRVIRIRLGTESERKEALRKKWRVEEWIGTVEMAQNQAYWAQHYGVRADVHLELDSTHMGRSGFPMSGNSKETTLQQMHTLAQLKPLRILGLAGHFPLSENSDPTHTLNATQTFIEDATAVQRIVQSYGHHPVWHINNSAGTTRLPEDLQKYFQLNRVGVSLYGQNAYSGEDLSGMQDVMQVYSHVSAVHTRNQGDTLGYDSTYTVSQAQIQTANIPLGWYILPRHLNNKKFYITNMQGARFNVLGKLSANTLVVEAQNNDGAVLNPSDTVQIMGGHALHQNDLAALIDTDAMYVTVYIGKSHESRFLVEE